MINNTTLYPLAIDRDKTSQEFISAFYAGNYFNRLENGKERFCSINSFEDGDKIRIVYAKIVGDFNFSDSHVIDREFSVTFVVNKQKEAEHV